MERILLAGDIVRHEGWPWELGIVIGIDVGQYEPPWVEVLWSFGEISRSWQDELEPYNT